MEERTLRRARGNPLHSMGDLSIDQDLGHHRHRWAFQRAGRVAMALFLSAGLVGVLGPGPLSRRHAVAPDGSLSIDYRKFEHRDSETEIRIDVAPTSDPGDRFALAVSRGFLDSIDVVRISPEPESVEIGERATTYRYRRASPGAHAVLEFDFQYEKIGRVAASIGLEDKPAADFHPFVYP